MTEILGKHLNFVELLTILQLITFQNRSDGNNIKPQAIKKASKIKQIRFFTLDSWKFSL